jgi:hypothetical protein
MRTTGTDIVKHKLALDENLAVELMALGIIANVTDFSRQLGKNDTYYACMKNRGYSLHLGSLVFLASKLSNELNCSKCVRRRATLRAAITAINDTIQAKCQLREQELLSQ